MMYPKHLIDHLMFKGLTIISSQSDNDTQRRYNNESGVLLDGADTAALYSK